MDDLVEVCHNNPIREIYKRLPSPSKVQKCIFGHSKHYLQIEQLELMKMLFPSSKPHNEIIFLPKPPLRMMNATHYKISVDREEYKRDRLFGVLEQLSIKRAIIYCNSRHFKIGSAVLQYVEIINRETEHLTLGMSVRNTNAYKLWYQMTVRDIHHFCLNSWPRHCC